MDVISSGVLNLLPDLSRMTGVSQATLIAIVFVIIKAANLGARIIPDDATGWKGNLRKVCAFVGIYVSSRVTDDTTVAQAARAAMKVEPIPSIVEAEKKAAE